MLWYRIALSHRIEMCCVAWHDMCVRVYIAAHYHCTPMKPNRAPALSGKTPSQKWKSGKVEK